MIIRTQKNSAEFNFDNLYLKAVNLEAESAGKSPQFRLSSSPFCSIRPIFEWMDFINNPSMWSFKGDFYCNIGTSVHRTLQEWIPKANPAVIVGHWRCRSCCNHPSSEECLHCKSKCKAYKSAMVGPQICPVCKKPMTYEEFHYLVPDAYISGHSDGVLLYDPKSVLGISSELDESHIKLINKLLKDTEEPFKFPAYILEYKTTTKARALNISEPIKHHQAQAMMYVGCKNILKNHFGLINIDIKGTIIKYISRDTPDLRSKDFKIDVQDDTFYRYNKKMVKRCISAFKNNDISLLFPKKLPCATDARFSEYYCDCAYKEICDDILKSKKKLKAHFNEVKESFLNELKQYTEKFKGEYDV